jgi:hypothetical protein
LQAITIQETAKYVVAYGAGSLRQRRVIAPAISKRRLRRLSVRRINPNKLRVRSPGR